jgi:alkanesulfonate monooxygenase SsuD/methylene tetrahydromethanopterin reductase-like flavin-dependent oxidoreductase (luciferase family)
MIRAWKGEPLHTENGDEGVCLAPLPVQKPHPPLWVAAFGPLALKQAGGLGLPYLCSPIEPLAMLKSNYALHREATKQAGHAPAEVVPVMRTILVTDNAALAKRVSGQLANSAPRQLQGEDVSVDEWAIVGDRHYARDRLAEYAEQLGITHLIGGGRLPRLEEVEQLHSQQHLLEIAESL